MSIFATFEALDPHRKKWVQILYNHLFPYIGELFPAEHSMSLSSMDAHENEYDFTCIADDYVAIDWMCI